MNLEEFKEVLSRRGIRIVVRGAKEESDKRLKDGKTGNRHRR